MEAGINVRSYTAIVEQDTDSKQYVGYIPGIPGAHSQADSLDELQANLREVMEMIFEVRAQGRRASQTIICKVQAMLDLD